MESSDIETSEPANGAGMSTAPDDGIETETLPPASLDEAGRNSSKNATEVTPTANISGNGSSDSEDYSRSQSPASEREIRRLSEMVLEMRKKQEERDKEHDRMMMHLRQGVLPGGEDYKLDQNHGLTGWDARRADIHRKFRGLYAASKQTERIAISQLIHDQTILNKEMEDYKRRQEARSHEHIQRLLKLISHNSDCTRKGPAR